MIIQDMHLHSKYSDGKNSPEEMVKAAIECGIKKICFTDHVRQDSIWIQDYIYEIERCQKKYLNKIEIRIGVEAKIIDFQGNIDCPRSVLENDRIEKVAALHRIPLGNGEYIQRSAIANNIEKARESWKKAINGLQKNAEIDRLAHPFSLFEELKIEEENRRWWQDVLQLLQRFHGNVEFNVKYSHEMVPNYILEVLQDKLVYGSDSHSVEELSYRSKQIVREKLGNLPVSMEKINN